MLDSFHSQKSTSDNFFSLRISLYYAAVFLVVGCFMPFLPLWLQWRGLGDFEISLIYAVPVLLRGILTPFLSFAADKTGKPARFLFWLSLGSLLATLALPFSEGFAVIFAVIFIYTLFWMSILPITDAIALAGMKAGRGEYGRMRLWGSLSYIAMTSLGGVAVDLWGAIAALWLFIGGAVLTVLAAYLLPSDDPVDQPGSNAAIARAPLQLTHMLRLLKSPELWIFLAAASAIQSAHALYYIFGTLHWSSIGISPTIIGLLWGIGVVAEIVLFAYARHLDRWFGASQLLAVAGAAAVLRWTVTAFDPPLWLLFFVQILHALSFGAAHLGAMRFMTEAVSSRLSASAHGIYASVTPGISMALVSLAAGPLYRNYGGQAFFAMAGIGAIGLIMSLILARRWQGGEILGADILSEKHTAL